ncbi:MAG: hypothetical protein SPI44_02910 [Bacilli bacterium]|nr:hypothetical protein [Mollicutes bacterium]MDY6071806.1 hypothetical protein [Bacilli bacterium]
MNIVEYFEKLNEVDKLTQAFLIGNVLFDDVQNEINEVLQKYIFNNNIDNLKDNPDVYILKQDEVNITKDVIKDLLNKLSTTSQFNNKKVYIIDKTEYLSDTVFNAILKTLEEPKEGIYAILISNNIDAVKPTIVSRCQKIFLTSSTDKLELSDEIEEIANNLIDSIEENGPKTIAKNYKMYNIITDRDKFVQILKTMMNEYHKVLKSIIEEKNDDFLNKKILENNNLTSILNKMLIIDNTINLMQNYLNKNLSIDRFIIEMWRCNI